MGLFHKEIQALHELQYLFEEEILLDGTKIKDMAGYVPEMSYRMGTQRTMYWYQKNSGKNTFLLVVGRAYLWKRILDVYGESMREYIAGIPGEGNSLFPILSLHPAMRV